MEMNQMKRKVLSLAMIAALCLTMLPTAGWAANDPVAYIDFDENGVQKIESREKYSLVTENNTEWNASDENNGWYVVSSDVTIGTEEAPQRVTVSGDVHLILANGADLTVNGGIGVNENNSLTIYAQPAEKDKTMGSLTVENVEVDNAGIGGDDEKDGGTITINGGSVTATGGLFGAGIGGGDNGSGGMIEINGGEIIATGGSNGAGIGGGDDGAGGGITINGGDEIVATGNDGGTGIGGGMAGAGGTIEINGGVIHATAANYGGAGIGSGGDSRTGSLVRIMISGGTVVAQGGNPMSTSGSPGGAGIGSGGYSANSSTITISGGMVTVSGGKGADGIGDGGNNSSSSQAATFSTGDAGNAVIYATAGEGNDTEAIVGLKENNGAWNAIVFVKGENGSEANTGKVYGNVSLANDLTIKSDQSLEIPDGTSLTVPAEKTLKVESGGTLTINGELVVYGELEGYTGDTSKIHQKNQSDTTWHTDATHHWYGCAVSGCSTHQFDKAAHNITDGKCSACGKFVVERNQSDHDCRRQQNADSDG